MDLEVEANPQHLQVLIHLVVEQTYWYPARIHRYSSLEEGEYLMPMSMPMPMPIWV